MKQNKTLRIHTKAGAEIFAITIGSPKTNASIQIRTVLSRYSVQKHLLIHFQIVTFGIYSQSVDINYSKQTFRQAFMLMLVISNKYINLQ